MVCGWGKWISPMSLICCDWDGHWATPTTGAIAVRLYVITHYIPLGTLNIQIWSVSASSCEWSFSNSLKTLAFRIFIAPVWGLWLVFLVQVNINEWMHYDPLFLCVCVSCRVFSMPVIDSFSHGDNTKSQRWKLKQKSICQSFISHSFLPSPPSSFLFLSTLSCNASIPTSSLPTLHMNEESHYLPFWMLFPNNSSAQGYILSWILQRNKHCCFKELLIESAYWHPFKHFLAFSLFSCSPAEQFPWVPLLKLQVTLHNSCKYSVQEFTSFTNCSRSVDNAVRRCKVAMD